MKFKKLIEDEKNKSNLLIIDSLNLAFRYKWKNESNYAASYIATVESLANSYGASKIVILGDWGSSWRKSFYPEYKANREVLRQKQTEQEAADFKAFLEELNNAYLLLKHKGYPILRIRGVEADDIAAYVVANYSSNFEHTWLISSDKDWHLLLADNVSQFSYVTRKETTVKNWPHNCRLEQYIDLKILQGDAGDNIGKPDGLGPKRAEALLEQYDSVFDMDFPIPGTQKFIQNLNEFAKDGGIERNFKLMSLLDYYNEAIGDDVIEIEDILGDYLNES